MVTKKSNDEAQKECPENEAGVPLVDVIDQHHAQKQEYNGVTGGAEHFDEVLDGRVGLVRNIRKGVVCLNKAATDTAWITRGKKVSFFLVSRSLCNSWSSVPDDSRKMEQLRAKVREIGHSENRQRLND